MVLGDDAELVVAVSELLAMVGTPTASVSLRRAVGRVEAALEGASDRRAARPPAAGAILEEMESGWLVAELRRRGDRRVTLAGDLADEGPSVDELMEAARQEGYQAGVAGLSRELVALVEGDVSRGTCPVPVRDRRECGRPAAEGEERLCADHAVEADRVAAGVHGLLTRLRWAMRGVGG